MKKTFLILLLILSAWLLAYPALAADNSATSSQLVVVAPQSFQTIQSGYSSIQANYDSSVTIYGYTRAYYPVSQIGISFNLQYLSSDGSWVTLRTYTYSNYYSDYISKTIVVPVSSGFFYRVVTEHFTVDNGIRESGTTITQSVYVP